MGATLRPRWEDLLQAPGRCDTPVLGDWPGEPGGRPRAHWPSGVTLWPWVSGWLVQVGFPARFCGSSLCLRPDATIRLWPLSLLSLALRTRILKLHASEQTAKCGKELPSCPGGPRAEAPPRVQLSPQGRGGQPGRTERAEAEGRCAVRWGLRGALGAAAGAAWGAVQGSLLLSAQDLPVEALMPGLVRPLGPRVGRPVSGGQGQGLWVGAHRAGEWGQGPL